MKELTKNHLTKLVLASAKDAASYCSNVAYAVEHNQTSSEVDKQIAKAEAAIADVKEFMQAAKEAQR